MGEGRGVTKKKEAEAAKKKAEDDKKKAEDAKKAATDAQKKADDAKKKAEDEVKNARDVYNDPNATPTDKLKAGQKAIEAEGDAKTAQDQADSAHHFFHIVLQRPLDREC